MAPTRDHHKLLVLCYRARYPSSRSRFRQNCRMTTAEMFEQAFALHRQGKVNEAEPMYRAILARDPNHFGALRHLGVIAMSAARLDAAVSVWTLREYLQMLPADGRNPTVEALAYFAVPLHYGLLWLGSPFVGAGTAAWIFGVLPLVWIFTSGPTGMRSGVGHSSSPAVRPAGSIH